MSTPGAPTGFPALFSRPWPAIVFGLLLVVVAIALRWPGLEKQIWNLDEASTFTMAQIVRDGGVLYRDAADNRTPLVPYLKALMLAATGDDNLRGPHLLIAAMLGLTAVGLWRLGRAGEDEATGAWAAGYFTLLSFIYLTVVDTMSAHTGWFLIFFSTLGMGLFVLALTRGCASRAILAGAMFGLAALAKQPGLLDWGVCLMMVLLTWITQPGRWRVHLRLVSGLGLGLALPLLATFAYFAAHGAWPDFLRYAWNYNTELYVPAVAPLERLWGVHVPFSLARHHAPFALLLGLLAATCLLAITLPRLRFCAGSLPVLPWLILGWTASGLASTILSGRDFAHYSIQVLPGLSLACGWITVQAWRWTRRGRRTGRWALSVALATGLLSMIASAIHRASTFDTEESLSLGVGQVIQQHTHSEERIFVWGYEPELHVFSRRLPATRFIYAVFLTGLIPWTNLDPLQDTSYAIVPGSWDDFWRDFAARPPAMIIDTQDNRGFLKYPLAAEERLWRTIKEDYVEIIEPVANQKGYAFYRRTTPAAGPASPKQAVPGDHVSLDVPEVIAPGTHRVGVGVPPDTRAVSLWLNHRLYQRMENPAAGNLGVRFFIRAEDLPEGVHTLQALAEGPRLLASVPQEVKVDPVAATPSPPPGPALWLHGQPIAPLVAEAFRGEPRAYIAEHDQWQAHPPSRLVYRRPPELAVLEFALGIRTAAYDWTHPQRTDGVGLIITFTDDEGRAEVLYNRHIDPANHPADRGLVRDRVLLPGMRPGTLTLQITPGPRSDPAYDWTYWQSLRGERHPLQLAYRGDTLPLVAYEADLGMTPLGYAGREVFFAHAPSEFVFRQSPGMARLRGEFGLLDSAWSDRTKTVGATFEVEQRRGDGHRLTLFSRTLRPATVPADRGVQNFTVKVPAADQAQLHFIIRPADPANNAYNHTFWHDLAAEEWVASIAGPTGSWPALAQTVPNGLADLQDESGREVLFAHAPSRLDFALPPTGGVLRGAVGLLASSYQSDANTDGATFVIELREADGHTETLWRRVLQPRQTPGDRGPQPFSVALPARPEARLVLRTEAAPNGRIDYAWSYWHDLHLEPGPDR
jgi:hypothetical protein